jgi:nucleotide-binding universal stress UspA family protein
VAVRVAAVIGRPVRVLHVRPPEAGPGEDQALLDRTTPLDETTLLDELGRLEPGVDISFEVVEGADVVAAVVAALGPGALLVMRTEHANRWSAKGSTAEHLIDAWGGLSVLAGPGVAPERSHEGPVLVALDGSTDAERAVPPALGWADSSSSGVVLVRVVPDDGDVDGVGRELQRVADERTTGATVRVVVGNDPVTALSQLADELDAGVIALSSHGDRASTRSTISRTCTGLAATAARPLLVVGPDA